MRAMNWLSNWFRRTDSKAQTLRRGYLNLLSNVALIQMSPEERVMLSSPSKRTGDVTVTVSGMRPTLGFTYWPPGVAWSEALPVVSLILEPERISKRVGDGNVELWSIVTMDDPAVRELNSLFMAFAYYQPIRADHKRKASDAPDKGKEAEGKANASTLLQG